MSIRTKIKIMEKIMLGELIKLIKESYIKSKDSICQNCVYNMGFNGKFYDCVYSDYVEVLYEDDGSEFQTKIIKCDRYKGGD